MNNAIKHSNLQIHDRDIEVISGDVTDDVEAIDIFLRAYERKSAHTFRSYEKECKRFLLWLRSNRSFAPALLPDVTVNDINSYIDFLSNPRNFSVEFLLKNGWKHQPFRSSLSPSSIKHAIIILHQMFSALRNLRTSAHAPYCLFNPVVLAHDKVESDSPQDMEEVEQALTDEELAAVFEAIEALPRKTERDVKHYQRSRWIIKLLYHSFLRRDEAAKLSMSSFEHSGQGWNIRVLGKRGKKSKIICTDALLSELVMYRESLNLPALPSFNETRPAILSITDSERGIKDYAIYEICKVIFEHAAQWIEPHSPSSALRLRQASPHWLRHTGISHSMNSGISPRYVQAQARHSSLNTTARYDHKDRQAWRTELNEKLPSPTKVNIKMIKH